MFWLSGVVGTLAWGAVAFGSNYPWAYTPLMIASAGLGLTGLWLGRQNSAPSLLFTMCLALGMAAVVVQLVPLPKSMLAELSPRALAIMSQHSIAFGFGELTSHPLSIDPSRTKLGLAFFGSLGLLLLGTARVLTRQSAGRLAASLMILGVALAIVGIVQNATFNGKIYGFWELVQGGSPFGPFVNRNHFAGWMLMGLPAALGYFFALASRGLQGRKPGFRNLLLWFSTEHANHAVLTAFAILVMAVSLVLTKSRSGIMALVFALVFAGTVMTGRQSSPSRRALTVAYLVLLVVSVVFLVGLDQIAARFTDSDFATAGNRVPIWADTIRIANDFWLTGTGLNTYGTSTLYYQTSLPGQHLREAHSDYLQLAAEGGLLLSIPIVLALLAFCWEIRRRLREDEGSIWWIRMGTVTGLLAIALQSTVEFSLQMPGNAALFAVVAGLAIHDGRRI